MAATPPPPRERSRSPRGMTDAKAWPIINEPDCRGKGSNPEGRVVIGKNVTFRELTVVNKPTGPETRIGDECYIMSGSFIGHDCSLGYKVTLGPRAAVAGSVQIGDFSNIGMNSSVHQGSTIGRCCMLGAGCFFKGTSPDGITWAGIPARPLCVNEVGIARSSLLEAEQQTMKEQAEEFLKNYKKK
mmetsp:Transcript_24906/g.59041  ORF Transcript_24906/g.59041 Transcript_24906/m.59041 type:complete len:186 (+) Transcript_24906:56-613(+)